METKLCKKCGRELSLDQFNKNHKNKDGLQTYCKECLNQYNKDRYRKMSIKSLNVDKGLSAYTPRELMEELKRRGYTGRLEYVETHIIDFDKL